MKRALYDGDSLIDPLTLLHKLSQLISGLLYNHLQILVTHWMKGVYRGTHSGGWIHDLRSRHNITSTARLEHKMRFLTETSLHHRGRCSV